MVRSCLLITLIKCLKGHKSLELLLGVKAQNLNPKLSVSQTESVTGVGNRHRAVSATCCTAKKVDLAVSNFFTFYIFYMSSKQLGMSTV